MTVTVTVEPDRIAWAHDVRTDPRLPTRAVTEWLHANGVTRNHTVRIEILAGDPPVLRYWTAEIPDLGAKCCDTVEAAYRNHLTGPYTTRLVSPLPPELVVLDGGS